MSKKSGIVLPDTPAPSVRGIQTLTYAQNKRQTAKIGPTREGESPVETLNRLLNLKYQLADAAQPNTEYPQFPIDIHDTHIAEIGRLHGLYTAWANYIDECLAVVSGDKMVDDDQREMSETVARLRDEENGYHKKKDAAKVSADTRARYEKAIQSTVMAELLKAKLRSCERSIRSLSRELSRRGLQVQIDG